MITASDAMQQMVNTLTTACPSNERPSFLQTNARFWYDIQRHVALVAGREPMTREQSDQWLVESPTATYLGDGLWQITDKVLPGDCSRLEWA